ncbi:MAG: REP element-mobilizing transposase RayT [Candidatus Electronema aureum]|uniref:REP element-mobilizing transposase RayT n=1 Tax=Candidatus Electronema aureum TaxID=2005002 RepID=A0A521G3G7_9BACT|nr:MAG: REP element-mobilizing transposase RayT [Candidatus Electronema aureum]
MRYEPAIHHRRSIRLTGYDYSQGGAYFVTICTQDRECLFGEIVVGVGPCAYPDVPSEMRLNTAGQMIREIWHEMPEYYSGVALDAFTVMPNHLHGIVVLSGQIQGMIGQAQGPAPTLPDVMRRYKTLTTKRYADGVKGCGWRPFPGKLWQRNYWERVIRDEHELNGIREYIENNPARWTEDQLNAPTPFM